MFELVLVLSVTAALAAILGLLPGAAPCCRPTAPEADAGPRIALPQPGVDYAEWLAAITRPDGGSTCRLLGRMADGTHVLRATQSGPGAPPRASLLFLRLAQVSSTQPDGSLRSRAQVSACGCYPLGDAAEAPVAVLAHRVEIGASRARSAVALAFEP